MGRTLTPEEKGYFFALMNRLRDRGVSLIFVSHAIEEVLEHSDRVTILRDGEKVLTAEVGALDRDKVIRSMVGRTLSRQLYDREADARKPRGYGRKVLSVQSRRHGRPHRRDHAARLVSGDDGAGSAGDAEPMGPFAGPMSES